MMAKIASFWIGASNELTLSLAKEGIFALCSLSSSTSWLRQAGFDRLASTGWLRQAQPP